MNTKTIRLATNFALLIATTASAEVVTFTGSGTGPFSGSFGHGTVTVTASGSNLVGGDLAADPNSTLFPFATDQIIGITDIGDTGAVVDFVFTDVTFGNDDYLFITTLAGESDVLLAARTAGSDVDADWNVIEEAGPPLVFDDDGAGLNATISGTPNQPGGVLLQPTTSGLDQLVISWTGSGFNNQGLQFGLVSIPEPSTAAMIAVPCLLLILRRRSTTCR